MSEKVRVPGSINAWLTSSDWGSPISTVKGRMDRIAAIAERNGSQKDHVVFGDPIEVMDWLQAHPEQAIRAVLDGYEVEEPKFRIMVLPGYFLKNPVTLSPFVQQLFTTYFNDPTTIWTISEYKSLLSSDKDLRSFLPPFDEGDPHFEKVEDGD